MAIHVSPLSFQPTNFMSSSPSSPLTSSSCSFRSGNNKKMTYPGLGCGLALSSNSNFPTLRRSCSNGHKGFSDEDMSKQIEELTKRMKLKTEEDTAAVAEMSRFNRGFNLTRKGFPAPSLELAAAAEEGQMGILDYCSVKKAFSSMVFMIRELQSYAMHIREHMTCEDLQGVVTKVHREMNASFVWLFQQVFSQTPTLMVFVMVLMANFTVHSMTHSAAAATVTEEVMERDGAAFPAERTGGKWELTKNELDLWKSVVEEAVAMQGDHDTMKLIVSPLTVEIQKDEYEEFFRTDLLYQIGISQEPSNPLLLSNYAKFLYLVSKDHDRAEQCFKRAIMAEPPDAEALSSYADYLWVVKKDMWEAEERYQEAMEVDPENLHHSSKYANFLWSTGAEDTCFPLIQQQQQQQDDDDNHDETT